MENNIERNQDSERGIFYAIIGVATLVITLIGATFAYLSASTNSAPNAVTATGATITLGYSDVKTGLKTNLIPIDETLPQFAAGGYDSEDAGTEIDYRFVGIGANDCHDVNGNVICSVYQFTVSNPAENTASQKIYGFLDVNENTFKNLHYALFKGDASQVSSFSKKVVADASVSDANSEIGLTAAKALDSSAAVGGNVLIGYDVDGTAVANNYYTSSFTTHTVTSDDAARKTIVGNPGNLIVSDTAFSGNKQTITWDKLTQTLDVGETMTYTMVMWVHETGSQQDGDQGGKFKATVRFNTSGGGTGVTGDLSVG